MPGTAAPNVEMTGLQGLADLERMEGPWIDGLTTGDPEVAATTMRLLLAHLAVTSKRLVQAGVLDRLDRPTACEAVGRSKNGPAPKNGTTIATFEGTQGIPPTPSTLSQP